MRDQRDADARRSADQKIKTDAKLAQLSQELKAAQKQRASQERRIASDEYSGGRQVQRIKGTSALARDQGIELDRLRAALATRSSELGEEETRRRRAEGELAASRTQLAAAEHKMAAMTKAMSLAKIQLQKQKNEIESGQKTIQKLQHEHPSQAGGAYGDLIYKAQSTIRSMQTPPSGAVASFVSGRRGSADSSSRNQTRATRRRPATAGPHAPSTATGVQPNGSSPTSAAAMCLADDLSGLLGGLDVSASKRSSERADVSSRADAPIVSDVAPGELVIPTKTERDALFSRFDVNGPSGILCYFARTSTFHQLFKLQANSCSGCVGR